MLLIKIVQYLFLHYIMIKYLPDGYCIVCEDGIPIIRPYVPLDKGRIVEEGIVKDLPKLFQRVILDL